MQNYSSGNSGALDTAPPQPPPLPVLVRSPSVTSGVVSPEDNSTLNRERTHLSIRNYTATFDLKLATALTVWKAIQPREAVLFQFHGFISLLIKRTFYARISSESAARLCFSDVMHTAECPSEAEGNGWGKNLKVLQSWCEIVFQNCLLMLNGVFNSKLA